MTEPPKPTPAQQRKLDYLYREFGRQAITLRTINRQTGHMRIEATAAAGTWVWAFNRNGVLVQQSMRQTLFDMPPQTTPPRHAVDN